MLNKVDKLNKKRCSWCEITDLYRDYHDKEWGRPCHDDCILFEFLTLEGAQAGLSWLTILKRRKNYIKIFRHFNVGVIANFTNAEVERMMNEPGLIRNRAKIKSTINNAARFLEIQSEFGSFDKYIWRFVGEKSILNNFHEGDPIPTETEVSRTMSIDLRKRGFLFVGPTICYAFMQAIGMVNDHYLECWTRNDK
ncbi:MAG: DNA-3-methyladenine glycosylase I [Candidatus Adiutrix intracellularis]|jgi:DNA-3-methyladenine glycosylase I|nr:DNA-3-methyladenine glycosylase I [Candidatus Adiutrix intracellularis]